MNFFHLINCFENKSYFFFYFSISHIEWIYFFHFFISDERFTSWPFGSIRGCLCRSWISMSAYWILHQGFITGKKIIFVCSIFTKLNFTMLPMYLEVSQLSNFLESNIKTKLIFAKITQPCIPIQYSYMNLNCSEVFQPFELEK